MALNEHDHRLTEQAPVRHFLISAGGTEAGGGAGPERPDRAGNIVATFHDEGEAREAFRRFQRAHPSGAGWGELAVLDGRGRIEPLSWFGISSTVDDDVEDGEVVALAAAMRTRDRKRQREERSALRRRVRGAGVTPVLRPVTDRP